MKLPTLRSLPRPGLRRTLVAAAALVLGVGTAVAAATQPASAAAGCSVSYTVGSQWTGGFGANILITNLGSPLTSWTLAFDFPAAGQSVTQGWNGTFVQSQQHVTVTSVSYNGALGTNGTANPGFNGAWTASNPVPTSFTLNGTTCNGTVTGSPSPTSASPSPTTSTSPPPAGSHVSNPFSGASFYRNPDYTAEVQAQASADGSSAEANVANYPTGVWMDTMAAINGTSGHRGLAGHLDAALAQQSGSTPIVFEVVVYDLPGRDCAALASNGEVPATAAGLDTYEHSYIDPIASILSNAKYANVRIVAIIEPDSLPNAVTNQSKSACAAATPYYETGIEYALNKLHAISNVYNYLDIAHSAWLGWSSNFQPAINEFAKVANATSAGKASLDGFISNTANYTPTTEPFLPNPTMTVGGQPLDSATFYQYNPYFDELSYDQAMRNGLVSAGFSNNIGMLIDTSRNGWGGPGRPTSLNSSPTTPDAYVAANKIDQRPFRGDWCNQNNAGIGARPAVNPASGIMAYVWIKPPGESDGDYPSGSHTHGDPHCDPAGTNTDGNGGTYSTGSIPGFDVPAGQWYAAEFQMLARNAYPAL
jgi:cellulose 1,4-beta-cellobiosidase